MSQHDEIPLSGSIPVAVGQPGVVRIPIPGEHRLAIEFWPRNYKGKSTSTLFIQDPAGKRHLRLDYGPNPRTGATDFHWNQRSVAARFGIQDHTPVGRLGRAAYQAARGYRWAGRVLIVVGLVVDGISIVEADQPIRRATEVVSAWALAAAGCRVGGYVGAGIGTAIEPGGGTAAGGFVGCIVGGYAGYHSGEVAGDVVYQWAEHTMFTHLPEVRLP